MTCNVFWEYSGVHRTPIITISAILWNKRKTSPPNIRIRRNITGTASPEQLGEQASIASYHVVQEALTNIRKYAGPHVDVHIKESWNNGLLTLTITDNGHGAAGPISTGIRQVTACWA